MLQGAKVTLRRGKQHDVLNLPGYSDLGCVAFLSGRPANPALMLHRIKFLMHVNSIRCELHPWYAFYLHAELCM